MVPAALASGSLDRCAVRSANCTCIPIRRRFSENAAIAAVRAEPGLTRRPRNCRRAQVTTPAAHGSAAAGQPRRIGLPSGSALPPVASDSELKNRYTSPAAAASRTYPAVFVRPVDAWFGAEKHQQHRESHEHEHHREGHG